MTDEKGEAFFVGRDVAKALGYSKSRNAVATHVDSEDKKDALIQGPLGGAQRMIVINESGLYSLILSSNLEQAKAVKRWVTAEVLPQIRKTGGYIPTKDAEGRQLSNEEILQRAEQIVGKTLRLLNAPSEDCMTATAVAKTWGMDVHSFNNLLEVMGIQYVSLVECKHYKNPITREKVQALNSKILSIGAHKGILISTSNFQSGAIEYAGKHGIALIQITEAATKYEMRGQLNVIQAHSCEFNYGLPYIGIMQEQSPGDIGISCHHLRRDCDDLKEFLIKTN